MKRSLFLIPLAAVLSACSAVPVEPASAPDTAFSADAEISYDGVELTAKITRTAAGEWELRVTEPYALEGLTMTVSGGETTLSLLGLDSAADVGAGAVSMARALSCAYDAAAGGTLTGTSELGSYAVTLDESSLPSKLTAGGLDVTFLSFSGS